VAFVLLLLFLVVPVVELYVIVQVAQGVGVLNTMVLLVVVSVVGSWLVKHEGVGVLRRMRQQLDEAKLPTDELTDGVLILFAGALMLTPGFLTDLLALLLLLPPTRAAIRLVLLSRFRRRIESGLGFTVAGPGGTARAWSWTSSSTVAAGGGTNRVDVGDAVIVTSSAERTGDGDQHPRLGGGR
jgi:UPF0716 protein FxsA